MFRTQEKQIITASSSDPFLASTYLDQLQIAGCYKTTSGTKFYSWRKNLIF